MDGLLATDSSHCVEYRIASEIDLPQRQEDGAEMEGNKLPPEEKDGPFAEGPVKAEHDTDDESDAGALGEKGRPRGFQVGT